MRLAISGLASLLMIGLPVAARAATCTVTAAQLFVKEGGFVRPLPQMVGYAIPVEVNENAGTFAMDFSGVPDGTFSISGVGNSLAVSQAGMVAGSIDGAGNAALPAMPVNFTTDLLPGVVLGAMEPLSTGLASVTLSGTDYATNGAPLDFTSGALRLEGQGLITNAPVVGVSTSGFGLSCTLAPIPTQANLPAGPSLVAHGTSKTGKPVEGEVVGDTLVLKGKIKNGAVPLDPTKDVFVRLGLGTTDLLVVRVPAGSLVAKGRKLSASDTDGSVVHLVVGRKKDGPQSAAVSGALTLVQSKKGLALTLKQTGADLAALATAPAGTLATVRVGIGTGAASDDTTDKPGAKKSMLK